MNNHENNSSSYVDYDALQQYFVNELTHKVPTNRLLAICFFTGRKPAQLIRSGRLIKTDETYGHSEHTALWINQAAKYHAGYIKMLIPLLHSDLIIDQLNELRVTLPENYYDNIRNHVHPVYRRTVCKMLPKHLQIHSLELIRLIYAIKTYELMYEEPATNMKLLETHINTVMRGSEIRRAILDDLPNVKLYANEPNNQTYAII